MSENYENFIKDLDILLEKLFENQKNYIKCKKGCSYCCEKGDYPVSQTEFKYITQGYIKLSPEIKIKVQNNIKEIIKLNEKEYKCPFLIDKECCIYKYRGIICRTFGLCYYDEENKYVRLPECVNFGLNYSEYYEKDEKILKICDVPQENLRIDKILTGELAKKHSIELTEIRPLINWIK